MTLVYPLHWALNTEWPKVSKYSLLYDRIELCETITCCAVSDTDDVGGVYCADMFTNQNGVNIPAS